jgi:hypothetical protein
MAANLESNMAKKNPRLLPKVQYDPRGDSAQRGGGDYEYNNRANSYNSNPTYAQNFGGGGGMPPTLPPVNYNPIGGEVPPARNQPPPVGGQYEPNLGGRPWNAEPIAPPQPLPVAAQQGMPQYNPVTGMTEYPDPFSGVSGSAKVIPTGAAIGPTAPPPTTPPPAGNTPGMAGPGNPETVSQWQSTLDKNQNLTQQATAAGDSKEMARLQAEWDRIAPKAAKYGITADRLINSYMQPGNDAAETSLDRAMGRAIADDTWAEAFAAATGGPPQQIHWDEHWQAMNKGGRDPLEGHPAAVQAIQAKMKQIEADNQQEAYNAYQTWAQNATF